MKYVKIPTKMFSEQDVASYEKSFSEEKEEWEVPAPLELSPISSFFCLPLKDLEGCLFSPTSFLDESDEAIEVEGFSGTSIITVEGNKYSTTWDIATFVSKMVGWGLIDESFKKEVK